MNPIERKRNRDKLAARVNNRATPTIKRTKDKKTPTIGVFTTDYRTDLNDLLNNTTPTTEPDIHKIVTK
jgi:hypothetical protein